MNLLYLVHRIPYPPNKGDKIRSYHELAHLARRHRVHLGCLADDADDLQHAGTLRQMTASCEVVPLDLRRARLQSLAALAAGAPLSVRWFESARLRRWVERTVREEALDAVLVFSSSMASYVEGVDLPCVMDFCDVDSDKWRQYAARAPWPLRPVYALEARRLRQFEMRVLRRCSAATLVTERERALWSDLPADLFAKVHVIPNGVDLDYFAPATAPRAAAGMPPAIVFTGAMDYYANVDAVVFFAEEVLPRVRAAVPEARFTIVGNRPTPRVQALARRPGVEVTGFVADTRPYYAGAAVCVVPLRIARGIQNKLLEAMAMGRPVVASPAAAAGLGARSGDEVRVADGAAAMAAAVVDLLRDPQRATAMGDAARRFVEREYVWERAMDRLEQLLASSIVAPRQDTRVTPAEIAVPVSSQR
jgi:sugar transferase (PEP-CTERM/EpsH1 system associated)